MEPDSNSIRTLPRREMVNLCIQVNFKRSLRVQGLMKSHHRLPGVEPHTLRLQIRPLHLYCLLILPRGDSLLLTWQQRSLKSFQRQPNIFMIGFTIFGSGQPACILRGPSSYQFYHRIIHLPRSTLRRAFVTKEVRHEIFFFFFCFFRKERL
ncbi:hypothetical protein L207DRAFT_348565 [Hyaloscypha variabilis F]|uniref:Uncharacterized protein n=1 Tax=Hyaloscypha variabilis (strain UAMH 11265 / GT02V1 / F) TaxID=1149755 RepID=A0A2J6RRB8_HYAVF|nr:hypothetical protein L207DRAFT_348565 [Hyaloscypha variabilis F]